MNKRQKKMLLRIIAASVLLIIFSLLPVDGVLRFALFMIPYLIVGFDILHKSVKGILRGQVFDESFLMGVATVGAIVLGEYAEGVSVMLFFQIGELFQSYAVNKSRRNISQLMDIRPDYANLKTEKGIEQVDPDEVSVGSLIVVQPGEKIPIDGVVASGNATLNTSALTGESIPRDVQPGDDVISGCINMTGVLEIRTTREFGDSTVSKILDLVENSSSRKSRSERFITRFSRYYTPGVCISALVLAVIPPVVRLLCSMDPAWGDWIYRGLTFLVISCPCALIISIPLTFFAGIGSASRRGILVKGSNYLELLSKTSHVVLDKTGTLTQGIFEVSAIHPVEITGEKLLEYAAHAECYSNHPISRSLRDAYPGEINQDSVTDVQEVSGRGIQATVDGTAVCAGNEKWIRSLGAEPMECREVGSVVHVTVDGRYAGCLVITDRMKKTSAQAIARLRKQGVHKIVMLTGDSENAAREAAEKLGVDQVFSQLLPDQKVSQVENLLAGKKKGEQLVFVGDGINDAPVLARADVGIAMGAMGSDAAIEAADVVLMDDDPMKIADAIELSRRCMAIVYENIYFSIGVKFLCLILGAIGITNMWIAIFADVGVMILAVLNAIRMLFVMKGR